MRKTRWRRICRKNKLLPIVHLHLCKGLIILEKNEMGLNDFFFRKDFFHRFIFFVYFITRPINMTGNRRFVNLLKSKQKYKPILSPQVILKRHTHTIDWWRLFQFTFHVKETFESCKNHLDVPGNFLPTCKHHAHAKFRSI